MLNVSLDLAPETESLLVDYAATIGKDVPVAIGRLIELSLVTAHNDDDESNAREFRPNADTLEAIAELDRGGGKKFTTIEELMADLNADND